MKIEKSHYQGYIWYSDSDKPIVYYGNSELEELEISEDRNPFIIEAQLFDGKKSIAIKYVDSKYHVNMVDVKELDNEYQNHIDKYFLPSFDCRTIVGKSSAICKLKFRDYWKETPDPFCEGMEVLKPSLRIFLGFNLIPAIK